MQGNPFAYLEAEASTDAVLHRKVMSEIRTYNEEDLDATWAVLEWLQGVNGKVPRRT